MKHNFKRLLSLAVALVMIATMIPGSALAIFAAEEETPAVTDAVATVGETAYSDLQSALDAADGNTVKLLKNVNVTTFASATAGLQIASGKTLTLDLNGKTISCTNNQTGTFSLIVNQGNLTITGEGTISYTDSGNGGEYISNTISNYGVLTVENGTIENLSSATVADNGYPHAIDNNTTWNNTATLNINGGTVYCAEYSAIRQFCGNATKDNVLNITGGTIKGAIDLQNGSTTLCKGTLNITGGTFQTTANPNNIRIANWHFNGVSGATVSIQGGSFNGGIYNNVADTVNGFITGGTFTAAPEAAYVAEGFEVTENADGTYGLIEKSAELPTATVTEIDKDDLTFAMNFKAVTPTEEQLAYYGDWYADFELTVNKDITMNANGGADGYLAGQYDAWSENWVYVPGEDVTLAANTTLKIMEYAASLKGDSDLKVTYADVANFVKDFDCGVYFTPEFLAANPDLVVTLELKMYNPVDPTESYVIGETYTFTVPPVPTATVTELEKDDLTFAMNFKAVTPTEEQLAYYGDWYADFELTVNKDITMNANGGADGYLAGQYDAWSENWVYVPGEDVTLAANTPLKIMEYAATLMNNGDLKVTYADVANFVKDFNCGVYFTPEFLAANPDLEVTLELKMYNPVDPTNSYVIGETYKFTIPSDAVAMNTSTGKSYDDVLTAMREAEAGQTVILVKDVTDAFEVSVYEDTTLDLNGFALTAKYFNCYGDVIDSSAENNGLLNATRIMIRAENAQLPVNTAEGYRFVEVLKIQTATLADGRLAFQVLFEKAAHQMLKQGATVTGVNIQVNVAWTTSDGHSRTQHFVYTDEMVQLYLSSYNASNGKYSRMFTLGLKGAEEFENLTTTIVVVSTTGVQVSQ